MNLLSPPALARGRSRAAPRAVLTACLLAALALPGAWAGNDRDHERARQAVQSGAVLPLPTLLEKLQRTHPGQVLELELEREGGRWVYEVKLLQADGLLLKLALDAGTGQLLEVKRKRDETKDRARQRATEVPR